MIHFQIPQVRYYLNIDSCCFCFALAELVILNEIGGSVSKAIWRGSVIAAKEIPTAGNSKMLENELGVYRVSFYILCAYNYVHRSLNHPNLLSLLGTVSKPYSVILLMNYVNGQTLHNKINTRFS